VDLFEAISTRHSIRSFRPDPVPRELLDTLIQAAAQAPSALNEQPWRFYVATGDARSTILRSLSQHTHYLEEYLAVLGHEATQEQLRWYSELGDAPVIVVCTMPRAEDNFSRLNKHLSVGAAIQNMLLAATAVGLGACNITFSFWVRDEMAREIGVPEDRVIIALVVLGYPSDEPPISPPKRSDVAEYLD